MHNQNVNLAVLHINISQNWGEQKTVHKQSHSMVINIK